MIVSRKRCQSAYAAVHDRHNLSIRQNGCSGCCRTPQSLGEFSEKRIGLALRAISTEVILRLQQYGELNAIKPSVFKVRESKAIPAGKNLGHNQPAVTHRDSSSIRVTCLVLRSDRC